MAKKDETTKKILITVKDEKWQKAIDKACEKNIKKAEVKGFRKGKVPKDVFIKKYGIESLYNDALDSVIDEAYKEAFEKVDSEKIAARPSVDVKAIDKDHVDLEFNFLYKPEVKIKKYKGFKIKKEKVEVTKEEVEHEISHILDRYSELVIKEGKVKNHDFVIIDFKGMKDKVAFPGGTAENYSLEVGSNSFIPGFEEELIGMKKGEEKTFPIKFPEAYHEESLKGQEVEFYVKINEVNPNLGKTPLKHFTEFLYESIYHSIKYNNSSEDYLGRFYGEFMSYSGGDGQNLGIVLTPKHITELFCELLDLKPSDKILDPCCGTAGFLIASMHNMVNQTDDEGEIKHIKKHQLFGIEEQSYMFTIATTNMILRGDGKSNLENGDFLAENPAKLQLKGCNIGMMNPPYSMGSKQNPNLYEINFTRHLLDSLVEDGRAAIIVPQSTFTGKTKDEQKIKEEILKNHTLEGVITLNKNTFYGVGTNPCIAIFTAHNKHPKNKVCKFINFESDGYIVSKHVGLIDDGSHKDKKQHLLDVWFGRNEAPIKFCVETTVEATDEWLHSFYYFNDEIPSEEDFRKTIADYLTFEVNMITHGRGYLFGIDENEEEYEKKEIVLKVAESGEKYE